jgi:hypothetical protein
MNQFPPAPEDPIKKGRFELVQKIAEIFAAQGCITGVNDTGAGKWKNLQSAKL